MSYYLRARNHKTTTVEKGNKEILFDLNRSGLTGCKATAQLPNTHYEMEHANFWGTRSKIIKDGNQIGYLKINWKGEILFTLKDKDYQLIQFKMKYKGFFNFQFEVWVNEKYHLMTLYPESNWFKTNYRTVVHEVGYDPFPIDELMAIIAYGVRVFKYNQG